MYPNSHITKSALSLFLNLFKYFEILLLPISSSPSTKNLMLQGTSPVCFNRYSTAFNLVISSPLASEAPLPKILLPFTVPSNGLHSHNYNGSSG